MQLEISDEEYCQRLYRRFSDPVWIDIWQKIMPRASQEYRKKCASLGSHTEAEIAKMASYEKEYSSPEASFRGAFIEALKDWTLFLLGPAESAKLRPIPVCFLPTRDLNACAIRTPKNGAIVLMDSGAVMVMVELVTAFLPIYAFYDKYTDCQDGVWVNFAERIIILAQYCVRRDFRYLGLLSSRKMAHLEPRTETTEPAGQLILGLEGFLLMHEYGHITLNHLDPNNTNSLQFGDETLHVYNRSQLEEFEADSYAVRRLSTATSKPEAAFFAGLMFNFLRLCEKFGHGGSSTHPASEDRWTRIKKLTDLDSYEDSPAFGLDRTFARITKYAEEVGSIES